MKLKLLALIFVVNLFGCYHIHHTAGGLQKSLSMHPASEGRDFKIKKSWVNMWLWGLVGADIRVDKLVADEVGSGGEVTNLKIDSQMSFLNGLANFLTIGIYTPHQVEITGRYQAAAPAEPTEDIKGH